MNDKVNFAFCVWNKLDWLKRYDPDNYYDYT